LSINLDDWRCNLLPKGRFALLGTTMAPGYEDGDYQAGIWDDLIASYPQEKELITRLTRETSDISGGK
jgi:predicted cupin superfamily sugar epimerase